MDRSCPTYSISEGITILRAIATNRGLRAPEVISSRELVYRALSFHNPERMPRQLWYLPWAEIYYPEELKKIQRRFPDDIVNAPAFHKIPPQTIGDPHEIGEYIDEWGCSFGNIQRGVIGEVKKPLIEGEEWEHSDRLRIPEELLTIDKSTINEFCKSSHKFVLAGFCARPFERLQFLRGTEALYIDLSVESKGMFEVLKRIHDFYCKVLTAWAETDVDGLLFMDDWGAQTSLLINPGLWLKIFKPLYKDYIDIAHNHRKKIFMHSDGYILDIIPHLIDLGLDAINSQVFCMGLENLNKYKGKITFWGEIDRQHLLPEGTLQDIENAVQDFKMHLWSNGGCIIQCEFGPGAKPENVYKVFESADIY